MAAKWMLSLLCCLFGFAACSHFRGAILQWRPINPAQFDGRIEITHRIAWRRSSNEGGSCSQTTIDSQTLLGGGSLSCDTGCSGTIGSMGYYCTDFSVSEDWSAGERSYEYDATGITYFEASFASCCWISIVGVGDEDWEVRVKVNLTQRADTGMINTSPISAMPPVVRLQHGCNHTIEVPVEDVDGDDIRCRWAQNSMSECASVCQNFPAELNECTLRYQANGATGWYAVALQIEDFASPTDLTPLSSVPLQFLVLVFTSAEPCSSKPELVGVTRVDGSCVGVPFNVTYHEPIIAQSGGEGVSIVEISTTSPPGFQKSALAQYNGPQQWYVNVTWTPDESQSGPNIFCFFALDSIDLTSVQHCITLLGGIEAPLLVEDSITPMGMIFPNHTHWSLKFDKQFLKSPRTRYIRIHEESGAEVIIINVASSSSVTYPAGSLGRQLSFTTNYLFAEKRKYYVLLDPGVAVGTEFCGAESPAVRDSDFWVVTIADITPPTLIFTSNPPYTNDNANISWIYDEEASSHCTLQAPDHLYSISCNQSLMLTNLEAGLHSLFVQGTDTAGNVASTVRHTWIVDLTPPQVRLSSNPQSVSQDTEWNFQFYCLNEHSCTYICSVHLVGSNSQYTTCSGTFYASGLLNGMNYEFSVIATDGVGNTGSPLTYNWKVDTAPPTISLLNDVTLSCGDSYSPSSIGYPEVTDNVDQNPSTEYEDQPTNGCRVLRVWTARDDAGNEATVSQIITFTTPQPPQIISPAEIIIACGNIEDAIQNVEHNDLVVIHPCERPVNISYTDSTTIDRCGFTFTRTWLVQDDCGTSQTFQQNIRVLDQQLPDGPANGQINADLDEPLHWPQYPGAYSYEVYVWVYGTEQPDEPVAVVNTQEYRPSSNYPPGTSLLWQIVYVTGVNTTIPSPIWGFTTQSFPDLAVTGISLPAYAFSGQEFEVSWTVINVGNLSTEVYYWYDAINIGHTTDYEQSRRVKTILQNRFVDPQDGYMSAATVNLEENDFGNYYVFVDTDIYQQVNDIERSNNRRTSTTPLVVNLTPPPNLVVEVLTIPTSTFSGQDISIQWTVRNDGVGITASDRWYDQLFWSQDEKHMLLGSYLINGALAPGASYSKTATVSVPDAIYGNYSIIVVTDSNNDVYEYTSEDDNSKIESIDVILAPPPDLVVSSLDVDSMYTTGSTMMVVYSVRNDGAGEPFESFWMDQLLLTSLSSGQEYVLDRSTHYGTLEPGNSYSREVLYTVSPALASGRYNMTVFTDYANNVFESSDFEGNNIYWKEIQIEEQLSDLVVSEMNLSVQSTTEGNTIQLNYTITNVGTGPALGAPWSDQVGVSHSQIYSSGDTVFLGGHVQRNELPAGVSYIQSVLINVPNEVFGEVFVHTLTDFNNRVTEEDENNNIQTEGPLYLQAVFPDLSIEDFYTDNGPEAHSGDEVQLTWTVINEGTGLLKSETWIDELYLDTSSQLTSMAVKLADVAISTSLQPENSYNQSTTVQIPSSISGAVYLFVRVNGNGAIEENSMVENNLASLQLHLSIPPSPDLTVTELDYSYTESERILTLSWFILNVGNTMKTEQSWNDHLFLSQDQVFDPFATINLGEAEFTGQLEPFQGYRLSKSIVIPSNINGHYYAFVVTDSSNQVTEIYGEGNNIGRSEVPIYIRQPPALSLSVQVNSASLPSSLTAGHTFEVMYEVFNTGEASLSATSWTDGVFLHPSSNADRNTILENGILLSHIMHNRQLAGGENYTASVNVTVPYGINQLMYIAVVVDINANFAVIGNLYSVTMIPLAVEDGPLSDLLIVALSTNAMIRGGEPTTVTYQVINLGENSAVGIWYEAIYLSRDAILDPFDIRLKTIASPIYLQINETYNQTVEVFIPFDLPSTEYYMFFQSDVSNHISELSENNNIDYQIVSILETVSTDIAVVRVTASPANLIYGDDLTFEWELRNNGSLEASGYKCDTVYLSEDGDWDVTDYQLGDSQCTTITLQAYDENPANDQDYGLVTITPFVSQQNYTGIVRTRTNIRDLNLDNNFGYTDILLNITAPSLVLGSPTVIELITGLEKVYRIERVPGEETLIATLTVNGDNAPYHDLFLLHGKPPTGYEHDAFSQNALSSNQTAVIRNTRIGTYYLRIDGYSREVQHYQVEVLVKVARFEILNIHPSVAAPLGNVTILFTGTVFSYFLQASVVRDTDPTETYPATNLYWFSSEKVYATFNASALNSGMYTVKLVDSATGAVAQLDSSLEIMEGIRGQLSVLVMPPRPLRAGENGVVVVFVYNMGNTDILTPMMTLRTGGNALLRQLEEGLLTGYETELGFLPLPTDGPGGILPPGASAQIYFDVVPQSGFVGRESFELSYVQGTMEPHIYLDQKYELKPAGIPDEVWDTIWQNFLISVGTTWTSLQQRVSEVATEFSLVQKKVYSFEQILAYQIQVAYGLLTGDVILVVEDIAGRGRNTILSLTVEREYSSYIHKRRTVGPMGMGWLLQWWELRVQNVTDTEVQLWSGRELITLPADGSGIYASTRDELVVTVDSEGVKYEESEDFAVYIFDRSSGLLTEIRSLVDNSTITLEYNEQQQPLLFKHSNGKEFSIAYNDIGRISSVDVRDENDNIERTSFYTYDVTGQFLTMVTVGDSSTTYFYNDQGDLININYASGSYSTLQYDSNSLLSGTESYSDSGELIESVSLSYNWNGKVWKTIQPNNLTQEIVIDTSGTVIAITTDNGIPLVEVELAGSGGNKILLADEVLSEYYFDEMTTTAYQVDANGNEVAFKVGENGELLSFINSEGSAYSIGYDESGRITEFRNLDGTRTALDYDSVGHITNVVNPDGSSIQYSYDSDDNMILKEVVSEKITYEYDNSRRLMRGGNMVGVMEIIYSENGMPAKVLYPNGHTLSYGYNNKYQRVYMADNIGFNVTYHYDGKDRLTEIRQAQTGEVIVLFEYDTTGKVMQKSLGNGAYTLYGYQSGTRRLTELKNCFPNGTLSSMFLYNYDKKGRITSLSSSSGNWTYRYDAEGQLIQWRDPGGVITEYTYDSRGNRIAQTKNQREARYSVNIMNQYTVFDDTDSFMYDQNGNLKRKSAGGKTEHFVFDAEGKLAETETDDKWCFYHYDALGNLNRKNCSDSTSFQYLVDPFGRFGADIVAEISDDGTTHFIHSFEQGLMAAMNPDDDTTFYYEFNGDGSVISILDDQGSIQNSYEYDPFGKVLHRSEKIRNIFLYVGNLGVIHDEELQDIFMMRARHYDAEHGRFISLDPIGLAGKSSNIYIYAYNSPLVVKDPTGRLAFLIPILLGVGRVVIGAGIGAVTYTVTAGSDFTYGGLAGAAASGAVGAAFGDPTGVVKRIVVPILTAVVGTVVQTVVDGKPPLEYFEGLTENIITNGIWANLPGKYLGPLDARSFPLMEECEWERVSVWGRETLVGGVTSGARGILQLSTVGVQRAMKMWCHRTELSSWMLSSSSTLPTGIAYTCKLGGKLPPSWYNSIRKNTFKKHLKAIRGKNGQTTKAIQDTMNGILMSITNKSAKQLWNDFLDWIRSRDPNDIQGPDGFGDAHFIPPDLTLEYKIRYENDPNATAPAQRVFIQHQLDNDLDVRTFRVGTFGFGDFTRQVELNRAFFQDTVNVTATLGVFVRVRAGIDIIKREATWDFMTLDPETGEPPVDPSIGFLPPNNGSTGQGFVTFTIKAEQQVDSLSQIDAIATIIFDQNEPIDTPPIFNTIDRSVPSVNLTTVQGLLDNGTLALQLLKSDVGSGVREVDIYQLTGSMEVQPILIGSRADVAVLSLPVGSEYKFFASAVDNVGNRRPLQEDMENLLLVDFQIVESFCINSCSQRGNCTEFGTCMCNSGFYGSDCSQDSPPAEPPVLEMSSLGGFEDNPIPIRITASLAEESAIPQDLVVQVDNFPEGSTFSRGTLNGGAWTFTPADFGDVELTLPQHLSGDILIEATALNNAASRKGSIQFVVQPVADPPNLSIEEVCYDSSYRNVNLTIHSSLVDNDGSETLIIIVAGFPENIGLAAGERDTNGDYILTPQDLPLIQVQFVGSFEPLTLSITAMSTERMNGENASTNVSVLIQPCEKLGPTPFPSSETIGPSSESIGPSPTTTAETTAASAELIIIIASSGAGVLIVLILVLIVCICCICCCVRQEKKYQDVFELKSQDYKL